MGKVGAPTSASILNFTPLIGTAPLFVLLLAFFFPSGRRPLGWRVVGGAVLVVLGGFLLTGMKRL